MFAENRGHCLWVTFLWEFALVSLSFLVANLLPLLLWSSRSTADFFLSFFHVCQGKKKLVVCVDKLAIFSLLWPPACGLYFLPSLYSSSKASSPSLRSRCRCCLTKWCQKKEGRREMLFAKPVFFFYCRRGTYGRYSILKQNYIYKKRLWEQMFIKKKLLSVRGICIHRFNVQKWCGIKFLYVKLKFLCWLISNLANGRTDSRKPLFPLFSSRWGHVAWPYTTYSFLTFHPVPKCVRPSVFYSFYEGVCVYAWERERSSSERSHRHLMSPKSTHKVSRANFCHTHTQSMTPLDFVGSSVVPYTVIRKLFSSLSHPGCWHQWEKRQFVRETVNKAISEADAIRRKR